MPDRGQRKHQKGNRVAAGREKRMNKKHSHLKYLGVGVVRSRAVLGSSTVRRLGGGLGLGGVKD